MSNPTFNFVGKLAIGKESEKFKPYEERTSDSGWFMKTLKFNLISGTNRHNLQVKSGNWKDEKKATVWSFTKKNGDEKGKSIEIKWADRNKPEIVEKIAEFKKFIIDLGDKQKRADLQKAVEDMDNGVDIPQEKLDKLGVTLDTLKETFERSLAKRHEFIHESDFITYLKKLFETDKYKDKIFSVSGNIEFYKNKEGNTGMNYVPHKIYLVNDDAEQKSIADYTVFFNKDSLDTLSLEDKGNYYLNCFVRCYDSSIKKDMPYKVQLVIQDVKPEDDSKGAKWVHYFTNELFKVEDDSWKEVGLRTNVLNGSQRIEVTEDMFSDTQRELIELEMYTVDEIKAEIRKELGKDGAFGDRITETRIAAISKSYSKTGAKETGFTDDDFYLQEVSLDDDDDVPFDEDTKDDTDDTDDIFKNLDDDIEL